MSQPLKDAMAICKTIMRNGYDAHVINARLQAKSLDMTREFVLDISTESSLDELRKIFPALAPSAPGQCSLGKLEENGNLFTFYPAEVAEGAHPEECLVRMSPRLMRQFEGTDDVPDAAAYMPWCRDPNDGFVDFNEGEIRFAGLPDETLKRDYLRAVRALRFSANYHLPIEANTWISILRGARRVLDYVAISDIMEEWRRVDAENMWDFVRLMYESTILHGLIPEVASMAMVKQMKNEHEEETVLEHTLQVMRYYPEELPYDWYGTLACLFHDVGKLFTADYFDGQWTFYQHHRAGAKVTRKILNRLRFMPQDIDLVCHLVRHHSRFHFMLTDRGIRRFKALDEYPRLIEMARADLKARGSAYTEFNHNMKMLERTVVPEEVLEPYLNGKEIMSLTGLPPGPNIGVIRQALLNAQISGDVASMDDAVAFVKRYVERAARV